MKEDQEIGANVGLNKSSSRRRSDRDKQPQQAFPASLAWQVVPPPAAMPFYYRMQQPLRGIVSTFIVAAVAAILYYVGGLDFWWTKSPLTLEGVPSYGVLPLALLMVFCWAIIFIFYQINYPFQKFSQPLQGGLATLTCLILGSTTYYIFAHMAHLTPHLFDIAVCWLVWLFFLGPFGDNPITTAYQGQQPISGVSGFITTLGLGLLTWWLIPESFLGIATGFPWLWLFFAVVLFRVWPQWPFPLTRAHVILRVGYLSFFTFILLWILSSVGLNFFANSTQASAFVLVWLVALLVTTRLFQWWPLHRMHEVPRGWLWLAICTIVGILVYWLLLSFSPDDAVLKLHFMMKTVAWGFSFFVGYIFYWGLCAGQWAPPPGSK